MKNGVFSGFVLLRHTAAAALVALVVAAALAGPSDKPGAASKPAAIGSAATASAPAVYVKNPQSQPVGFAGSAPKGQVLRAEPQSQPATRPDKGKAAGADAKADKGRSAGAEVRPDRAKTPGPATGGRDGKRTGGGMAVAIMPASSPASEPAAEIEDPNAPRVIVRLLTPEGQLASDQEQIEPLVQTVFDEKGSKTINVGDRATLWVRNANVDGNYAFELYHEGKYINRRSEISILAAKLAPGEHVINPGGHVFEVGADGRLSSKDAEIQIDGLTVALRVYPVDVLAVDGAKTGPADYRLVSAKLGLVATDANTHIDPADLPNVQKLPNMLSHSRDFHPLRVYLPANAAGSGYLLYPSWQAFTLEAGGKVKLLGQPVPGIEAADGRIVISYRVFTGRFSTTTHLQGGVGEVTLKKEMFFSPTLEKIDFRAGIGLPAEGFLLPVNNDFSINPNKLFLADNTTKDPNAIRLLAMEWGHPVFTRGEKQTIALRFLQSPGLSTVASPTVRMSYSRYMPSSPDERAWLPLEGAAWADGNLTFTSPEVPYDFYVFRAMVVDAAAKETFSELSGEFMAAVIAKGQTGTASFATANGRNAFVAGEDIRLGAILRSASARPAGPRTIVLKHPDGEIEKIAFQDGGEKWIDRPLRISADISRNLAPGRYELTWEGLPETIAALPMRLDLAPAQKSSLYEIIKPSKYTGAMNNLYLSHMSVSPKVGPAIDLDRAVDTLAEMGYNRVEVHTYLSNLHVRPHTARETLAEGDERLMAPASVFTPIPRDQMLNACVRDGLEYADIFLFYGDFHLPRYLEGYIEASKRWVQREVASMRNSPAFSGLVLYDEMYDIAAVGQVKELQNVWPKERAERAAADLKKDPAKIQTDFSRYLQRPKSQRDPQAMADYLEYGRWERHGWGDYNTRVADAAREVDPAAKIGTYHRTWMLMGGAVGLTNGYPPDVFANLDWRAHIHYCDNCSNWVHSCIMADVLRFGPHCPVWVNMPMIQGVRNRWSGEFQRHMAFGVLQQGADGVSQWSLPTTFTNGPNPGTIDTKETTGHLNRQVLAPLGEIVSRTEAGYHGVGIVITFNQFLLNDFTANMAEELWVACWRLGYQPKFLYEDGVAAGLSKYSVVFVPGVKVEEGLDANVVAGLKEAIKAGTKVIVEKGSDLKLPGVIRMDELTLQNWYVRHYFPTWLDDELEKVYEKSQETLDLLAKKLPELGVAPTARGAFKVGPTWRSSGSINYLLMANFDDPNYGYQIKQIQAKPLRIPITVSASRGKAAYDLLAGKAVDLTAKDAETALELDMTHIEGAMIAFVPEPVGKLDLSLEQAADARRVRVSGHLLGASGKAIDGAFPTRIRLLDANGATMQEYFRVLGGPDANSALAFELSLPAAAQERSLAVEVRESVSGQTARVDLKGPVRQGPSVALLDAMTPSVPHPAEVKKFLGGVKEATLIVSSKAPGLGDVAKDLVELLAAKGIKATLRDEMKSFHLPLGDANSPDPLCDGFHGWYNGQETIQPSTVVDEPVIILSPNKGSYLLDALVVNGFVSEPPRGGPGEPGPASIQVAPKGLNWKYDTLCLIANDAASARQIVEALRAGIAEPAAQPAAAYAQAKTASSAAATTAASVQSFLGTNEQVVDMKFDKAGNLYVITWGHGDNLYSLDPAGKLRFSRHLPEADASRLDVYDDRVLVFTAAGGKLYQVALDGGPISQLRLTMDPGPVGDDGYELSSTDYEYMPESRHLVQNIGTMRVLDDKAHVVTQWQGEKYQDHDVSDRILTRQLRAFVTSPDRTRLAQLETSMYWTRVDYLDRAVYDTHLVIRDPNGALLHEFLNVANEGEKVTSVLSWPQDAPGPCVVVKGEIWQFDANLSLLYTTAYDPGVIQLGGMKRLAQDGDSLRFLDGEKPEVCRIGPLEAVPTHGAISPDGKVIALLDEYFRMGLYDAASGKQIVRFTVPQIGHVVRFSPDSSAVLIGSKRGGVFAYDLTGAPRWGVSLGQYNKHVENPPLYDPAFGDLTETLWPSRTDQAGELEELVKMGDNRLVNGDCQGQEGWAGEHVEYIDGAYKGGRCLKVGASAVGQEVAKYLGRHVTWVLEFQYKAASDAPASLMAGLQMASKYPSASSRKLPAGKDWQYGRLVDKSGMDCQSIQAGFKAVGGEVLVSDVKLRQIRFPSINLLFYEPIHEIEPVVLTNPLLQGDYQPVGDLRMAGPGMITVPPYSAGGQPLLESAFLQNGRLNEVCSYWYEMPPDRSSLSDLPLSLTLKEAHWVSHVVLYFNCYDEQNTAPHYDIYVTDLDQKKEVLAASVRNNRQLMSIVKFPPIRTTQVRVVLVNSIRRLRTLTEIELYGPLAGKDAGGGFSDAQGQNTYMGDFTRVDKRKMPLADDLVRTAAAVTVKHGNWSAPCSQVLAADDKFYVSRTLSVSEMYSTTEPAGDKSFSRFGSLGYGPYVTIYGGLLLKCGTDGKLYCIDAAASTTQWSAPIGERPTGCPVVLGEDVFAANEKGQLYKLDLASGSVMMELPLPGGVCGSLACDGKNLYMICADGQALCLRAKDGQILWKTKVAVETDSTPAVDNGVVYLADREGVAVALAADSGKVIWTSPLGQEFCRCPVVTDKYVLFGCRDGKLACLARADGKSVWANQTASRFCYEPLAVTTAKGDEVLYFDGLAATLAQLETGQARTIEVEGRQLRQKVKTAAATLADDPLVSLSYYKGSIYIVPRHTDMAHAAVKINDPWSPAGGSVVILSPAQAEDANTPKEGNKK